MDTNENGYSGWTDEQPRYEEAAGKKPSPFADSPYVMPYGENRQYIPADPAPVSKEKKSSGKGFKRFMAALLVVCLMVASCCVTAAVLNHRWEEKLELWNEVMKNRLAALQTQIDGLDTGSGSVDAPQIAPDGGYTPAQVYDLYVDAVVAITTDVAMGSGFVVSEDGYIVSNQHVVDGANTIYVTMHSGAEYKAELVGYDASNDVSLLKIDAAGLPCVKLGSSEMLVVGDQVVAIGNPLGELTATLTVGYISAKDRIVTTEGTTTNMLQTDAAINSGNSGGPLFNMKGEVIGIITAKYSGTSSSGASIEGIGFAIPIDDVVGIIEDLHTYGYVKAPYLGVSVRDVDPSVIQNYGFPAGAYVVDVVDGISASRAGVKPMDTIINIGGYDVTSVSELTRVLRNFEPGDTTTITVFRSGAEVNLTITLDEKPQDTTTEQPEQTQPNSGDYEDWFNGIFPPFFDWG